MNIHIPSNELPHIAYTSNPPNPNAIFDQNQQLPFHPTSIFPNPIAPDAASIKSEQSATLPFLLCNPWPRYVPQNIVDQFPSSTLTHSNVPMPNLFGPNYSLAAATSAQSQQQPQQPFLPQIVGPSNNFMAYPPPPPFPNNNLPDQFQNFTQTIGSQSEVEEKIQPQLVAKKNAAAGNGQANQQSVQQNGQNPRHRYGPGTNNLRIRTSAQYRVVYNDFQRRELEREFAAQEFINTERKAMLSEKLHLTERQIKIWFQNRRAKERRNGKRFGPPYVQTTQFNHFYH